ncbi:MAG TPA: hypothetical protein VNQ76_11550 [Planctomicrobium sp.]|nr:hypothetical protein [Planctomicrobium sp.]
MSRIHDGSPILSGRQVRVATQPFVVSQKASTEKAATEKAAAVTVRREGDQIREIHVHCHCGETIVIDCDYGSGTVHSTHQHIVSPAPKFPGQ